MSTPEGTSKPHVIVSTTITRGLGCGRMGQVGDQLPVSVTSAVRPGRKGSSTEDTGRLVTARWGTRGYSQVTRSFSKQNETLICALLAQVGPSQVISHGWGLALHTHY